MNSNSEWLRRLTALHPAVNNRLGPGKERFAPHKPLLLLCVLELVEGGLVPDGHLSLSADLVLRFQSFWSVVVSRWTTKPDLRMPFHHLLRLASPASFPRLAFVQLFAAGPAGGAPGD